MAKAKAAPLIPRRSPRKHDKTAGTKTAKAKAPAEPELGSVAWSANEGALIWALLDEMQVKDNRLVLFGKNPGTTEGTKGDSKTAVYKRIGSKILPELFENSPNALGKRVKGKAEDLVTAYKKQAKKLQVTGGGLQNDGDDNDEVHEFLECYIPADGPDHDTTSAARNLWEEITKKFPYFPVMHKFLATRSNITPPAITTGVGPHGRKIVHLQPPAGEKCLESPEWDPEIDPALKPSPSQAHADDPSTPPPAGDYPRSPMSSPVVITSSSPPAPVADRRPGRGNTGALASSFDRALKSNSSLRPSKVSCEDKLFDLQTNMMDNANKREDAKMAQEDTRLKHETTRLKIQAINQLVQLKNMGVLDDETFKARYELVEAEFAPRKRPLSPVAGGSTSNKRARHHSRSQSSSSVQGWDSRGGSPAPGSDRSLGHR